MGGKSEWLRPRELWVNTNWLHLRAVCSLEVEALLIRNKLISEILQGPLKAWRMQRMGLARWWVGAQRDGLPLDQSWLENWRLGGNITNIYFLPLQFEKDRVNQVQNVEIKVQDLITAPGKFTPFYQRVNILQEQWLKCVRLLANKIKEIGKLPQHERISFTAVCL